MSESVLVPAALSACLGKNGYESQSAALQTLAKMRKRRARLKFVKRGQRLQPYQCRHCQLWHLGSGTP